MVYFRKIINKFIMHRNGHSGVSLSKCDSLEKSLKESEARFRALTTMAPVGIYLADVKGYFFYVNHRWCEMTGLSPREAVGLDWTNNIYSEDRDRVIKAWHKMVGAKDKFEIEYRCLNKSKKLTWVLSIAIPMINEDGKHTGFIGTCIDITERINAEVGLMESERKYRQLYQGSRDGYVMVDMSGKIIESNDAYKEMLGYSDEELSTKTYYDLTPGKWFDYEDKIVEEQVLIRGFSQLYEKEYIDKKGRVFPIELRTYLVVDKDKNPKAMWAFIRDITERKEIEEKLRLSEERWKIIFEYAPDGYYLNDSKGVIVAANRTVEKMLGYSKDEAIGKSLMELGFVNPDDLNRIKTILARNVAGFATGPEEFGLCRKDGSFVTVESRTYPIKIGNQVLVLGMVYDVTERKKSEKALRESEERFRSFVENANDIVFSLDSEGVFKYVSPNWTEALGHDISEVNGQPFALFVHKDDVDSIRAFIEKVISTGKKQSGIEYRVRHKKGNWRWHTTNASPIRDADGQVISYMGIAHDITERKLIEKEIKNSEEKWRMIFEYAPDGYCLIDPNGTFIDGNKAAEEIVGYSKEEAVGKNMFQMNLLPLDQVPIAAGYLAENLLGKPTSGPVEFTLRRKDGIMIPIESRSFMVSINNKRLVLAIVRDVRERKRREEELKQAYLKLKETQAQLIYFEKMETVGRLASGVAHEVKNPLAIILQGIEFLQANIDKNNEKIYSTLDFMNNAVNKADHVVKGLLEFSRKPSFDIKANDLTESIDKALGLLGYSLRKYKIEVIKEYSSCIFEIKMNKEEMEQVFVNIFMNAIDAMPNGGRLTIKMYFKELNQVGDGVGRREIDNFKIGEKVVIIEVDDTGFGIPENMVAKLFEPFFTTKRDKGGTGLGLSIVRNIISQHRGSIKVVNNPNGGVKVVLMLKV